MGELFFFSDWPCSKDRTSLARTAPMSCTYMCRNNHLFRQAKSQGSWLFIICLFISFVFHIQPDQAVIGEEMLATAALFVKLDSAKNLPVSVQCELSFIWQKGSAKSLLLRIRPQEVWKVTVVKFLSLFQLFCRWQMLPVVPQVHSANLLLEMSLSRAR